MVLLGFPLQGRRAEDGSVIDYELIDQDARVRARLLGLDFTWHVYLEGVVSHTTIYLYTVNNF